MRLAILLLLAVASLHAQGVAHSYTAISRANGNCTGATNDNTAFTTANTDAINWQNTPNVGIVEIDIGSGRSDLQDCEFTSGGSGNSFLKGIKQIRLVCLSTGGCKLGDGGGTGNGFFLGGVGQINDNVHSARIQTVSAGSSAVTLVTAGQNTRFTVGQWVLITGLDLQGFGNPTNPHFFEYALVTAINGSSGAISLSAPLNNSYKSTWPAYTSGDGSNVDQGGPATIYALDPTWDTEVYIDGFTIDQASQTTANGRKVTFHNCTFTTTAGIPSQNLSWSLINSTETTTVEMDKLVGTVAAYNSSFTGIDFQSSSIDLFTMYGGSISGRLHGTPKSMRMVNVAVAPGADFWPGAIAYGVTTLPITLEGVALPTSTARGGYKTDTTTLTGASITAGTITIPNVPSVNNPPAWAVPNTPIMFAGSNPLGTQTWFTVTDVTQSGSSVVITTSLGGGVNAFPAQYIWTHPAPNITCSGCTGPGASVLSPNNAGQAFPGYSGGVNPVLLDLVNHWSLLDTQTTSATSVTIGTGTFTFTVAAGLSYPNCFNGSVRQDCTSTTGHGVTVASAANNANFGQGYIVSYLDTALKVTFTTTGGSGTHTDWQISTPRLGSLSNQLPITNPLQFNLEETAFGGGAGQSVLPGGPTNGAGIFDFFNSSVAEELAPPRNVGQGVLPQRDMAGAGSWTATLRYKVTSLPTSPAPLLCAGNNCSGYNLVLNQSDHALHFSSTADAAHSSTVTTICNGDVTCVSPTALTTNHLYFITASFDAVLGQLSLSVDGTITQSATGLAPRILLTYPSPAPTLGGTGSNSAEGYIQDFSFFKSALSSSQITYLYNGGTPLAFNPYTYNYTSSASGTGPLPKVTLVKEAFETSDSSSNGITNGIAGVGFYRPYHLSAWNQTVATARGGNYVWSLSTDHIGFGSDTPPNLQNGLWLGYSSGPTVKPSSYTRVIVGPNAGSGLDPGNGVTYLKFEQPRLQYNAADPNSLPFYAYMTGERNTTKSPCLLSDTQETLLWRSADMVTWTFYGIAIPSYTSGTVFNYDLCFPGFANIYAPGDLPGITTWQSYNLGNNAFALEYVLQSSNPKLFDFNAVNQDLKELDFAAALPGQYQECDWMQGVFSPDNTNVYAVAKCFMPGGRGMALFKLAQETCSGCSSLSWRQLTGQVWPLGIMATDVYPTLGYIQDAHIYFESGTLYIYVERGFYPGATAPGTTPVHLNQIDLWTATVANIGGSVIGGNVVMGGNAVRQ